MTLLFGRTAAIIIGPRGGLGKEIRELRFDFKVEKSSEANPNTATIEIYNLSKETRALFEKKDSFIILKAGYDNEEKVIFQGDIARSTTKKNGADSITTVEAGDGEFNFQSAKADVTFAPGSNYGQVFSDLSNKLGVAKGQVKGISESQQFLQGYAGTGMVRDQLDYLTEKQGVEWSIQDGQLQVLPPAEGTDEVVILLTRETGLIGSPNKKFNLRPDLAQKGGKKDEDGVDATSLLNPEIRPGRRVKIVSELVNGTFKVDKVTHNGGTHSRENYSVMELK